MDVNGRKTGKMEEVVVIRKEIYTINGTNAEATREYMSLKELHVLNNYLADEVTSNLHGIDRRKEFDTVRLSILKHFYKIKDIIPYHLEVIRGKLEVMVSESEYSDAFVDTITAIAKCGKVLILSDIDAGMTESEVLAVLRILEEVQHTFDRIIVSTQCKDVVQMLGDSNTKFMMVSSKPKAIDIGMHKALRQFVYE